MKKLIVLLVSIFITLSANAADNVLQSVQIEPLGDTYNLVLVSDSSVPVKKTIQSSNRVMLSLKGVRMSKTLNTIYKNVSNVDNVIVEPVGVDGLNIILQGENAAASSVTFDPLVSASKFANTANPKKEVLLNAPMNTYSPIYKKENSSTNTISKESCVTGLTALLKSMFSGTKTTTMLVFGFFGLVFLLGAKLIRGKDNEISVGLSQSLRQKDAYAMRDMRDTINTRMVPSMTGGYKSQTQKPYTTATYGLKAYQNSTPSPYLQMRSQSDSGVMGHRTINAQTSPQQRQTRPISSVAKSIQETSYAKPRSTRAQSSTMTAPKLETKSKIDNVKFLESMSEIYEKSGRPDLANGIRTKLSKMV